MLGFCTTLNGKNYTRNILLNFLKVFYLMLLCFKWCDNVICFQQILDADGKYNTTRESQRPKLTYQRSVKYQLFLTTMALVMLSLIKSNATIQPYLIYYRASDTRVRLSIFGLVFTFGSVSMLAEFSFPPKEDVRKYQGRIQEFLIGGVQTCLITKWQ